MIAYRTLCCESEYLIFVWFANIYCNLFRLDYRDMEGQGGAFFGETI